MQNRISGTILGIIVSGLARRLVSCIMIFCDNIDLSLLR